MSLGMELGLGPGDFVLDGDPALLLKMGQSPRHQFSAHFYCGQMAGCIKMPLGMDIGLSPGDFVLYEDPVPSPKWGVAPQIFRTWHSRYWFVQVQVLVRYAFYF